MKKEKSSTDTAEILKKKKKKKKQKKQKNPKKKKKKKKTKKNDMEHLHAHKLGNLGELDNFIEAYSPPKLNQVETDKLNRLITRNEIEYVIKTLRTNKSPGPVASQANSPTIQRRTYTHSP